MMIIREGMKARFCPSCFKSVRGSDEYRNTISVTGVISYVNWEHRVFTVEYETNGTTQTEAFHFFDIGKTVTVYG